MAVLCVARLCIGDDDEFAHDGDEGCGLLAGEGGEFKHECDQGCGGGCADAGDGVQDLGGGAQRGLIFDQGLDGGADGLDLLGQAGEQPGEVGFGSFAAGRFEAAQAGGALLDEVAPGRNTPILPHPEQTIASSACDTAIQGSQRKPWPAQPGIAVPKPARDDG